MTLLPLWSAREIRVQYRQSALDVAWSLITPVVTVVGFGFVLTRAFDVDGDGVPYLLLAWSGMVIWTFVASGLSRGAVSLVGAADLVRKAAFPKEVVPLSAVMAAGVDLAVGVVVLAGLMVYEGIGVSVTAIAVLPILLIAATFTAGMAMLFAAATALVRDLAYGLNLALRIGVFVTPVMYPSSEVPENYRWALDLNPVAVYIDALRASVLQDTWPDWSLLGAHAVAAVIILAAAVAYVVRVEGHIADVV